MYISICLQFLRYPIGCTITLHTMLIKFRTGLHNPQLKLNVN
jgi:hypothetical protein